MGTILVDVGQLVNWLANGPVHSAPAASALMGDNTNTALC